MANDLRLQVVLQTIDKASAVLRKIQGTGGEAARALKETRDKLRQFTEQQRAIDGFRKQQDAFRETSDKLKVYRQQLDTVRQQQGVSRASVQAHEKAVARQTAAFEEQRAALFKLRSALTGLGVGNITEAQNRLRTSIASTTAAVADQTAKLRAQAAQQRQVGALKAQHAKAMLHAGMAAGAGVAAVAGGRAVARPLVGAAAAFGQQEDAAMQLRASMMVADGSVPAEFREISDLAQRLGDRLPGTTANFLEMMTTLRKEGMSAKAILGGLGEATAYLGVQLRMPVTEAASFAAKVQDATRATEGEMMQLMDTIQRAYYLGLDPTFMQQGLSKMSGVLGKIRKNGVDATNALTPLMVMMNQSGMTDGGSVGNAVRKVVDAGLSEKKVGKANKLLKAEGAGFKLNFANDKGQYAGLENLFAQLAKLKTIQSDMKRTSVMKELFGDDAETHQVLETLMDKGLAGYQEVEAKMKAQADLRKRVDEQLQTLKNVVEAAQGVFTNSIASVGEVMAPDLKLLIDWLGKVGSAAGVWVRENPKLVYWATMAVAVFAGLSVVLGALLIPLALIIAKGMLVRFVFARLSLALFGARTAATAAAPAVGLLSRLWSGLSAALSFASGLLLRVPALMVAIGGALKVAAAFLMANPLLIAIGLLAAAAYLVYRNWDGIKGGLAAIWDGLGGSVSAALGTIGAAILNWSPIGLFYQAFAAVLNYFGMDLPLKFTDFGSQIINGLVNGITSKVGLLRETIVSAAANAWNAFKEKLGIQSPSRVFMAAGENISEGAAIGIGNRQAQVRQAAAALAGSAMVAMPGASMAGDAFGLDGRPPLTAAARTAPATAAGDNITININAPAGMDPQAIARAVSAELDRRQRERGVAARSRLSDGD